MGRTFPASDPIRYMGVFSELRRRNIFRVALLYVLAAWLLLELLALGADYGGMPGWIYRFSFAMVIIGFPLALVFSWLYEITPEGLRREYEVEREKSITRQTGRRLLIAAVVCFALVVLVNLLRFALN